MSPNGSGMLAGLPRHVTPKGAEPLNVGICQTPEERISRGEWKKIRHRATLRNILNRRWGFCCVMTIACEGDNGGLRHACGDDKRYDKIRRGEVMMDTSFTRKQIGCDQSPQTRRERVAAHLWGIGVRPIRSVAPRDSRKILTSWRRSSRLDGYGACHRNNGGLRRIERFILNFEELETALLEVERVINLRPLAYVPEGEGEPVPKEVCRNRRNLPSEQAKTIILLTSFCSERNGISAFTLRNGKILNILSESLLPVGFNMSPPVLSNHSTEADDGRTMLFRRKRLWIIGKRVT